MRSTHRSDTTGSIATPSARGLAVRASFSSSRRSRKRTSDVVVNGAAAAVSGRRAGVRTAAFRQRARRSRREKGTVMAIGTMGLSFAPTSQNKPDAQNKTPIQNAIKVLSLRIPSFVGARSPIPNAFAAGARRGGLAGCGWRAGRARGMVAQDVRGAGAGSGMTTGPSMSPAPPSAFPVPTTPRFYPGSGNWPDGGSSEPLPPPPSPVIDRPGTGLSQTKSESSGHFLRDRFNPAACRAAAPAGACTDGGLH